MHLSRLRSALRTLLLLPLLVLAGPATAAGPQGIQAGAPINDSGTILLTDAVATAMANSGAGFVRVNFRLGPYPSDTAQFYSTYDTIVNRLRSKGLQVIGLLSNESWHGEQWQWQENSWEVAGGNGYNTYIDQFGYMAGRVAAHFNGRIKHWEIWNEPNCYSTSPWPGAYEGCSYIYPSNFAALLGHAYTQMKYYNRYDVQVISGGLLSHNLYGSNQDSAGATYLSDTYWTGVNVGSWSWIRANAGSYPLDHIGHHLYVDQGGYVNSSTLSQYLTWIRNAYAAYEGSTTPKKIFETEIGWTTDSVSEGVQASNITTTYNVMRGTSYVASAIWFYLQDSPGLNYGLYRASGLSSTNQKAGYGNYVGAVTYQGRYSNLTVHTGIESYFNSHGGMATNGSPYDNGGTPWVHSWDYGYVQDFDGGSIGRNAIMSSSSGTFQVRSGFWTTYLQGTNHTRLKFPTSDEFGYGSGTRQNFQGGYMTWDPTNGVRVF
ncbi:hypothetical protein NR798_20025 [Archangium gephyra]|uniref:LGFP repeat-containing protein n=1 Tax=Archangium gephyra TaxID=48 RepID=UPI0035D4C5AB